ncbi:hypothetical protein PARU111607_08825 [Palleronia rufa]
MSRAKFAAARATGAAANRVTVSRGRSPRPPPPGMQTLHRRIRTGRPCAHGRREGLHRVAIAASVGSVIRAIVLLSLSLAACAPRPGVEVARAPAAAAGLYPNETPRLRSLIRRYAQLHGVPESLVHRVIQRESGYRPAARNGPYYGLMQILPQTARTMGHDGPPSALLEAETNLAYAVKYLRGAWMISGGDESEAVGWYARGYYYEAKRQCLLVETGLNSRETAASCR